MLKEFNEKNSDFYDLEYFLSLEYRYLSGALNSRFKTIFKCLGGVRGKKILDAGCGYGYLANELLKRGAKVMACDYSKSAVNFTKERYPNLNVLQCSVYEIDKMGNNFDIIITADVIEHLGEHKLFLEKVHNILKPGGELLITTDNSEYLFDKWPLSVIRNILSYTSSSGRAYNLIKKVERHRRVFKNYHLSHINEMNNKKITSDLIVSGFILKEIKFFSNVSIPLLDIPLKLFFPKRYFGGGSQLILAIKK